MESAPVNKKEKDSKKKARRDETTGEGVDLGVPNVASPGGSSAASTAPPPVLSDTPTASAGSLPTPQKDVATSGTNAVDSASSSTATASARGPKHHFTRVEDPSGQSWFHPSGGGGGDEEKYEDRYDFDDPLDFEAIFKTHAELEDYSCRLWYLSREQRNMQLWRMRALIKREVRHNLQDAGISLPVSNSFNPFTVSSRTLSAPAAPPPSSITGDCKIPGWEKKILEEYPQPSQPSTTNPCTPRERSAEAIHLGFVAIAVAGTA